MTSEKAKTSLVSVILPNYNHGKYLSVRLASIFNQTYTNLEVIILDDASTDNSVEILNRYKTHNKVSHFIVNKVNSGSPFKQWDKGLKLAKGDYIWIAESDDDCELNFLENQVQKLENESRTVTVAKTLKFNKNGVLGSVNHPVFKEKKDEDYFLYCPILNISAVVFNRALYKQDGFFKTYNLIGDRVFYYESFKDEVIVENTDTVSYFRKETDTGLSSLCNKDLNYLKHYYKEHQHFAYSVFKQGGINRDLYKCYIKRFFNRVRNRVSRTNKLTFNYLLLLWRYKSHLTTH